MIDFDHMRIPIIISLSFYSGLGIGAKSSTVPVYAAETAPPLIRGACVMQWQVWSEFSVFSFRSKIFILPRFLKKMLILP